MTINGSSFWDALGKYLFSIGLSHTSAAKKIGMDRGQLSRALNSQGTPQEKNALKIQSALHIKIEQKVSGEWELYTLDEYIASQSPEEQFDAATEILDEAVEELEGIIWAYKAMKRGRGKTKAEKMMYVEGFKSQLRKISDKYSR